MTAARLPPRGRRAIILRACLDDGQTLSQLVRTVGRNAAIRHADPSVDRMKTMAAVRHLRLGGRLTKTPRGFRTTGAGLDLLRQAEAHHA